MSEDDKALVERLRDVNREPPSRDKAADRIEALEAEIERLRGALGDLLLYAAPNTLGSLPVFNRARAALAGEQ